MSSSSSQEGSRSRSSRRSRSPPSSCRSRSRSRRSSRSHTPSRSSHVSGGSSRTPPLLSWHYLVVAPTHASRRTNPLATVSRAPPSSPPVFVTPVGPAPPLYTFRSSSVSRSSSHVTAALSVDDASSMLRVAVPVSWRIGPPPAPRPASQSTPRLPVPATGSPAVPSPPPVDRVPTSIDRLSLVMDWLPTTPSVRSERRVSHTDVSSRSGGPLSPGVSAAVKSPRTHPRDCDVGSLRRQALLAAAATATALIDTASLPPPPSVASVPTGFRNYGLPEPRSEGPTLPWNPSHGGGC